MKKILILLLILMPLTAWAQWDWNVKPSPQDDFTDIYEMAGPSTEMQINYDVLHINPIYLVPKIEPAALALEEIPGQGLIQDKEDIIQTMQESSALAQKIDQLINQRDFKQFIGKDLTRSNSGISRILSQLIKGPEVEEVEKGLPQHDLMGLLADKILDLSSFSVLNKPMDCHGIDATTCYDVYAKFITSVHAGLRGLYLTAQQSNFLLEDKNQDELYISTYGVNRDPETWAEFFEFFSASLKEFIQSNREVIRYLEK